MYIARFNDKDMTEQPLKEHLVKVAEYCKRFAENLCVPHFAYIMGRFHDMGKYSDEFQRYIKSAEENPENSKQQKKPDHGVIGAKYIYEYCKERSQKTGNAFIKLTGDMMSEAICYHHGGLPDNYDRDCIPMIRRFTKIEEKSYSEAVARFWQENDDVELDELLTNAAEEIQKKMLAMGKEHAGFWLGLLIKNLYSMLVDADRWDSYMAITHDKRGDDINIPQKWGVYAKRLENALQEFAQKKAATPLEQTVKEARSIISDDCADFARRPAGIYTLTVPTGGGKTLASLRYALAHAESKGLDRIIYVLPYTTIIEQNAQVVRKTLACDDALLEYHSNVLDCHKNEDYEIMSERWDSPIIFTTMVQLLNAVYGSGNQNIRRMHHLENSLIIFDEIQSLPLKCFYLFAECVNFLNQMGNSTIVLSSATQPTLESIHHRVALSDEHEMIAHVMEQFCRLKRVNMIDTTQEKQYDTAALSEFALSLLFENKSVLIVVNRIDTAENIWNDLQEKSDEQTEIFFLSSHLCAAHRQTVIDRLKTKLAAHEKLICVSTQLIEAGVDLSFDTGIRSLAGWDSIVQAAGRINRHGERSLSPFYIVKLSDENVGNLPEILLGQKHTGDLLYLYRQNPAQFDGDLLSPKAVSYYYHSFYADEAVKEKMPYPLRDGTLYQLLNLDNSRVIKNEKSKEKLWFNYQFETARMNFEVINSPTKTIIVPYGEGKQVIADLVGESDIVKRKLALRKAQHYSVNIYQNLFRKLQEKNAFLPSEFDEIYIIKDGFYHEKKGVGLEKELDFLSL